MDSRHYLRGRAPSPEERAALDQLSDRADVAGGDLVLLARVAGWRLRVVERWSAAADRLEAAGFVVLTRDAAGVAWAACTPQGRELAAGRHDATVRRRQGRRQRGARADRVPLSLGESDAAGGYAEK